MAAGDIHHIVLDVADLERATAFYGEALGLSAAGRDLWSEGGPMASFRLAEATYLVLEEAPQVRPDPPGVHIRLAVEYEGWEELLERLRARGYPLRDERKGGLRAVGEAGLNVYMRNSIMSKPIASVGAR